MIFKNLYKGAKIIMNHLYFFTFKDLEYREKRIMKINIFYELAI